MTIKEWFKFILLSLVWGSSFLWIKIAVQEVAPLVTVGLRLVIGLAGLLVFVFLLTRSRSLMKISRKYLTVFAVLGMTNIALPFILIAWSEQYITSALASIINSTSPLFTMLAAPLFISTERITPIRLVGLAGGFIGVLILLSPELNAGEDSSILGEIAMFGGAILYAGSTIFARRTTEGLSPGDQALLQMSFGAFYIWSIILVTSRPVVLPHLPLTWVAVAWLGILGSAAGTVLFFDLLHSIGPIRTAIVSYIFPLVGVLLGVVVLHETIVWQEIVGGLLILSGVVFINSIKTVRVRSQPGEVNVGD
ncbi:MAG: DMT family transporter [Anaerolineaceae bacterium]